jgi:hypothetical protein
VAQVLVQLHLLAVVDTQDLEQVAATNQAVLVVAVATDATPAPATVIARMAEVGFLPLEKHCWSSMRVHQRQQTGDTCLSAGSGNQRAEVGSRGVGFMGMSVARSERPQLNSLQRAALQEGRGCSTYNTVAARGLQVSARQAEVLPTALQIW